MKNQTMLLPEVTATRAAQERRAAARRMANHAAHAVETPRVINEYAVIESDLLTTADRLVHHTLMYLSKGGNPVTLDLNSAANRAADRALWRLSDMYEAADERRAEHDESRENADLFNRMANRASVPQDEATAARECRDTERAAAAHALAEAQDIERRAAMLTHSDRADLVQEAAAILMLHGRNSKEAAAAVRRAVRAAASGSGYTQSRTEILRPATAEDYAKHTIFHDRRKAVSSLEPLPHYSRKGVQDGYTTIEPRKAGKWKDGSERPAGDYVIHRRQTAPAYISYEQYTENGEKDMRTNDGINAIQNQTDREDIERLISRANLNATERAALLYVLDNVTAANVMRKADEDGESTESLVNRLWREALRRAGVLTANEQDSTRDHITERLSSAEKMRLKRMREKLRAAQEREA